MKVLVACEKSGRVRDAFLSMGHDAMSCDLDAAPGPHYAGDVRDILHEPWDLLISHPPCTYLCRAGLHWNKKVAGRAEQTDEAVQFALDLWDGPQVQHIPKRVVENPIGVLTTFMGKPQQIIQPWQFGDDASKATCLWLHGVAPLRIAARPVPPRVVLWRGQWAMRWANQYDSGQNNEVSDALRAEKRSVTYPGVAKAMARQWST